jgi:glycosyltransferase involved in cell wall biosynthesis
MQHCFGKTGSGGPVMAFERLIDRSTLKYSQIRQLDGAGGINRALIRRFVDEIKTQKPDLIHIRGLGNEGFHAALAARIAGVPNILVSIHGTHRDLTQQHNFLRHIVVVYILETLTLLMATHLATVCQFASKRRFLKPFQSKLTAVVPNGVDIPDVINKDSTQIRLNLGISSELPIALCISRLTIEKGYLVLAEALKTIDQANYAFALIIVGGGDDDGLIKSAFVGLNHIQVYFVGHQNQVIPYLEASNFFIFPSLHENLSNALIEAMSYQLPVIATDVGGNTEVVQQGGGVLIPPKDPIALAAAIKKYVQSPAQLIDFGIAAQNTIRLNYTIQNMVSGWEKLYLQILDNHDD